MDKKGSLNSLREDKYFALFVGLIVALVHFVITCSMLLLMEKTYSVINDLSGFIVAILLAPSAAPIIMISHLRQIDLPALDDFSLFAVFALACSSVFYGISGGLLASNQKFFKQVGVAFISLLILSSCCILVLIY